MCIRDSTDTDADTDVDLEEMDYCHIQYPCSMSAGEGAVTESVYVWVYKWGVTDGPGVGADVSVELGIGAAGSVPDDGWTWTEASYINDKDGLSPGDLANDEYTSTLTAPSTLGIYDYAARTRVGEGPWLLCDLGHTCGGVGSDDGYDPATAGVLTVE